MRPNDALDGDNLSLGQGLQISECQFRAAGRSFIQILPVRTGTGSNLGPPNVGRSRGRSRWDICTEKEKDG